jgi:endonuclease YncB( thermonuclease family)
MMRPLAAGVLLVALALAALRWIGGAPDPSGENIVLQEAVEIGPSSPARPASPPRRAVRPIAPDLVAPPPVAPAELRPAEPRPPLSDLALAGRHAPGEPALRLLFRPVATAAGRIEAQGHRIRLAGLEVTPPEAECPAADGSTWLCGLAARGAFRRFLRGRAVECVVSEQPAPQEVTTSCRLGNADLSEWLVENGLARAAPGGPLAAAGRQAEAARKGLFAGHP